MRRAGPAAAALGSLTAAVLALAACTAPDDGPAEDPPGATASADPGADAGAGATVTTVPQDAAGAREAGQRVVGGLTAVALHPTAMPAQAADGSITWAFAYAPEVLAAVARPLLLAAPEGGTFEGQGDGSLLVRDAAGAAVAALPPPTATAGRASWSLVEPDLAALTLQGGTDATPPSTTVELGATASEAALASATWGEREGGRSLAVAPAPWVRAGSAAGLALLEAQLVAAEPEAGSTTMHDQLLCHAVGAPEKETWNLEPWRPDVGLLGVLAAQCNPT